MYVIILCYSMIFNMHNYIILTCSNEPPPDQRNNEPSEEERLSDIISFMEQLNKIEAMDGIKH